MSREADYHVQGGGSQDEDGEEQESKVIMEEGGGCMDPSNESLRIEIEAMAKEGIVPGSDEKVTGLIPWLASKESTLGWFCERSEAYLSIDKEDYIRDVLKGFLQIELKWFKKETGQAITLDDAIHQVFEYFHKLEAVYGPRRGKDGEMLWSINLKSR